MLPFIQIILEYYYQIMLIIITVDNHFLPSIKYFSRFHVIFPWFLKIVLQNSMIFPGFQVYPHFSRFSRKCGNPAMVTGRMGDRPILPVKLPVIMLNFDGDGHGVGTCKHTLNTPFTLGTIEIKLLCARYHILHLLQ